MQKEVGSFQVAGVTFEGRQDLLKILQSEYIRNPERKQVKFIPEPQNKYDSNAIGVLVDINGQDSKIGYVPKDINVDFKVILDSGKFVRAKLTAVANFDDGPLGAKIMFETDVDESETTSE